MAISKSPVWSDRDASVLQIAMAAFTKKGSLDSFWQEIAENHYPERADFTSQRSLGSDVTSQLYSSEPVLFRREFGNFLGAILRPKGRQWFKIQPSLATLRELTKVQTWLKPRTQNLRSVLYSRRSGYSRAQAAADHDYSTFGNCVGSCEETQDKTGLRFRTWHLRDCAWRQNLDGVVDTMFRKFKPTARDLCAKANQGWSINTKVKEICDKNPDTEINCMHIEMPILNYDYSIKKPQFDWVSLYYDVDNKHLLSFKQIPEFDYFVDRWFLIDGSPYGVSPCVVCSMPDARSLQLMTWSILEAGEKAVEPPLIAQHEAIIGGINIAAAAVTYVDKNYDERTGEVIRALDLGGSPQFGEVLREGITKNLSAAWFLNKLFMPQTYDKTAYEANRLHEEYLRTIEPIIEPAEAERNGNHLEIALAKSMRLGLLGPMDDMPEELKGNDIDFDYDNPMEDARKQENTFAFKAAMEVNQVVQPYKPSVIGNFDFNAAYRDAIQGVAPPNWLLDEDEAQAAIANAEKEQQLSDAANEVANMATAQGKNGMPPLGNATLPPPTGPQTGQIAN